MPARLDLSDLEVESFNTFTPMPGDLDPALGTNTGCTGCAGCSEITCGRTLCETNCQLCDGNATPEP